MSGVLLAGRFRVRALLGSGGTAAVFAAEDSRTGERVALKLLHPHLAEDPARWEAFFEEVRAARAVDHENIARILDAGVTDDGTSVVWIAMELAEGHTLADYVRDHGPLEPARAVEVAGRVLAALSAAHAQSVVHRDITPANVMIAPAASADLGWGVTLLDFGLADVPGRSTVGADALLSGVGSGGDGVVASVAYASPEQLSGAPVTEASDLYQVGALLFFMLTGRAPYAGDAGRIARAHLAAPPPLPSARRRGVPRVLDRVVATAMLKDPADRYPDAERMRAALDVAAPATVTEIPETATGPTRRYRTLVAASADATQAADILAPPGRASARGRWPLWAAASLASCGLVAIIALSAAAGSAPSAAPTRAALPTSALRNMEPTPTTAATLPPAVVVVPPLAGLSLADATRVLETAGLRLGDLTRVDAASAADIVLGADPGEGAAREMGATVSLRVSSGNNAVPAVAGMSVLDASATVAAAGFHPVTEYSGTGPAGLALAIRPGAGEVLPIGASVTLVAARSAASQTPLPSPSSSTAPSPAPSPSTTPTSAPVLP